MSVQKHFQSVSMCRLLGEDAVNSRGQRLGCIVDAAIEPVRGSIAFITIRYGAEGPTGKLFVVPWSACRLTSDALIVDVDPAVFARSPGRS